MFRCGLIFKKNRKILRSRILWCKVGQTRITAMEHIMLHIARVNYRANGKHRPESDCKSFIPVSLNKLAEN